MAETDEQVVIGGAVSEAKERIHVDREIGCDLINQTGVECADPLLVVASAHGSVKFDVAAQVSNNCPR